MKKIINSIEKIEEQMINGLVKAYPETLRKLDDELVVVRAKKKTGKVALISGGGSGHEPAHGGYVGYGMLDGAVAGPVFTSPSVDPIYKGIKAVDGGAGVLMVIKNYTGDVMNFEMAGEQAETDDGIKVAKVVVNDDVAVKNSTWTTGRRGVAGTVFVHKIAGAKAETGAALEEVQTVAQKVVNNVRTMGVGIKPCIVPAAGIPGFELSDDEMEIGIGIHGEPGVRKEKLKRADEITDELLEKILSDIDYSGSEVAVMVNGCGGTPLMELYIVNDHVSDVLAAKGIRVYRTFVGNYMTSIEMEGFSVSLLKLDDEMKELLDAPCDAPAFKVGGGWMNKEAAGQRHETVPGSELYSENNVKNNAERKEECGAESADKNAEKNIENEATGEDRIEEARKKDRLRTIKVLRSMIGTIEEHSQYLTELDNVIGDGDHGINMNRGFQAVAGRLGDYEKMTADEILTDVGKVLMKTVGGSSGPLYGSAFKKSGQVIKGKSGIAMNEFIDMLEASIEQIKKLGKSDEKDKTMLDAMCPALRAIKDAAGSEKSVQEVLDAGIKAAEAGIEFTKTIAARKGRASYLGDRSIGHADPGAVSFTYLLKAVRERN